MNILDFGKSKKHQEKKLIMVYDGQLEKKC